MWNCLWCVNFIGFVASHKMQDGAIKVRIYSWGWIVECKLVFNQAMNSL